MLLPSFFLFFNEFTVKILPMILFKKHSFYRESRWFYGESYFWTNHPHLWEIRANFSRRWIRKSRKFRLRSCCWNSLNRCINQEGNHISMKYSKIMSFKFADSLDPVVEAWKELFSTFQDTVNFNSDFFQEPYPPESE